MNQTAARRPPRRRIEAAVQAELLESRRLLSATVAQPIGPVSISGTNSTTVNLAGSFSDPQLTGTYVDFTTTLGTVEVQLFDQKTPLTVANFLQYANDGLYNNTIIHRSPPGFVVQGGGYTPGGIPISTFAPVKNEPGISNTAGTIAMAKIGGDPNSATSQWFFNVGDNSQNLDNQNGGFTVFGQVVQGLSVVNAINQLPTTTATIGPTQFTDLPVQKLAAGAQPTAANLVDVQTVNVVPTPTLQLAATSDNPQLLTASVTGQILTLNAVPGQIGFANVTVTATGAGGSTASQTFRVHVKGLASQQLSVALASGNARSISFRDANNIPATITYSGPGSATVNFDSNSISRSGGTVKGKNVQLDSIVVTGATAASSITVNGPASALKTAMVGDITVAGSLANVRIHHATLEGNLSVSGSVGELRIDNAANGTITIGAAKRTNLRLGNITNEGLTSAAPIGQLKVVNWVNDSAAQVFSAPSIRSLISTGNFTPSLTLTDDGAKKPSLGRIVVPFDIGGKWTITGKLPTLNIGGTAADFDGTFTDPIPSLRLRFSLSGFLSVPSIGRLRVVGSLTNGILELTAPFSAKKTDLASLTVLGQINQSTIVSTGSVGPISARGIARSDIFAGLSSIPQGSPLPVSATDFGSHAAIASITSRGLSVNLGLNGSNIAAYTLGDLNLGKISTKNSGVPFGIAAHTISALSATDTAKKQNFHFSRLSSAAQLDSQITARKLTLNDFKISLI